MPQPATTSSPLRVRIHLNLAKPERGENAVRIKSPISGAWITVGYATQLLLENCMPVVDLSAQDKIRQGSTRKIPHAFIEGDLRHFVGRPRSKAPAPLVELATPHLTTMDGSDFTEEVASAKAENAPINYNPRFAKCFYRDQPQRAQVVDRFEQSRSMVVVGWNFWTKNAQFAPIDPSERCEVQALQKTKLSETAAIRRGRLATAELLVQVAQEAPLPPHPRRPR